MVVKLFCGLF